MPYGKGTYGRSSMRRGTRYSRARSFSRNKRKVSVPRAPRKTSKQAATLTRRRNALAINSLARQVASLKRRDWGPVQTSHQLLTESAGEYDKITDNGIMVNVPNPPNWSQHPMIRDIEVQKNMPLLFDVNNYDCANWEPDSRIGQGGKWTHWGCNVFSLGQDPQTNSYYPFRRAGFVKARQATHDNPNPFWEIDQIDLVNGKPYKPLSCTYKFEIRGRPVLSNTYVTFTLFSQRSNTNDLMMDRSDDQGHVQMPIALEHLRNMEDGTNMFNPKYFKIYSQKKIFLNSQRAGSVHPTDNWQTEGLTGRLDDLITEEPNPDPTVPNEGEPSPPATNAAQSEALRSQTTGLGTTSNVRKYSFTVKPKSAYVPKYGQLVGPHLNIEMEDSPIEYNQDTGKQAYNSGTGEIYHGNYGEQTLSTSKPLWLLITTSDRRVSINTGVIDDQTKPILDNQVIITCSRYCKWRDGEAERNASTPFFATMTGMGQ